MNYTVYIKNTKVFYNITYLNSDEVKKVISLILSGAPSIFAKGGKYNCEYLEDIQIFESESKEKYLDQINSKEILKEVLVHTGTQIASFTSATLSKFNKNVTENFIPRIIEFNPKGSNNEILFLSAKSDSELFFKGQYFDAIFGLNKIIAAAQSEIKIVDNYLNDELIEFLSKKNEKVNLKIITSSGGVKKINTPLLSAFNKQKGNLEIRIDDSFHDRFVIIDDSECYHFGASLKDLGNKTFMFSKIKEPKIKNSIVTHFNDIWNLSKCAFP